MTRSIPDALASPANLLKSLDWQRRKPWLQEVRVPTNMPGRRPVSTSNTRARKWVKWNVIAAQGGCANGLGSAADGAHRPGLSGLPELQGLHGLAVL